MSYALDEDYIDPVAFGPKQLVSSSKLVRSLGAYIEQSKKRPIFIMRDNEVEAVLVSIDDYRILLEEEARVEDLYHTVMAYRRIVEHLKSGEELFDLDKVLKEFDLSRHDITEAGITGDEMDG